MPTDLRDYLLGHDVSTVNEMGWAGTTNGLLLARSARHFDALITADQNIRFQQNLAKLPVSVAVLVAQTNALPDLVPLVPKLQAALAGLPARALVVVRA